MSPCKPQASEFETWFASLGNEAQREVLEVLRKSAERLGVTVTYTHLVSLEDSLVAEDALNFLAGRSPQLSLN